MIKYAIYHPVTGEISQWGEALEIPEGLPPDIKLATHEIFGPLTDYYVDPITKAVTPKVDMTLTLPGPTEADGETEAVIDGLPTGTVCEFFLNGELQRLVVTDGNLEVALLDPTVIRVTFWHPTARHDPVEVTFV